MVMILLLLPSVALAKNGGENKGAHGSGNPPGLEKKAENGNGSGEKQAPGQEDKQKIDKENNASKNDEADENEKPEKTPKVKPDKKSDEDRGRAHAIAVITAKLTRMPESALKGLKNALASIGKWLGIEPPDNEPEEPPDQE